MIKIINSSDFNTDILAQRMKSADVRKTVSDIIADVRDRGDRAIIDCEKKFTGADIKNLEVSEGEINAAFKALDSTFISVLEKAAENISLYHKAQKRDGFEIKRPGGVILGQRVLPLRRAGLYIPGGTASYPSSVLMSAIPAGIAGVSEIVMTTPPARNSTIPPAILAAARIAGVGRIFKTGGAQAIAALAYGTQSIPGVDKITGPGNVYVSEAKKQVYGDVAIDMIAGPSEILIIADQTADCRFIAADMLSQAEHDEYAAAVLVTTDADLAKDVQAEIEKQLLTLSRRDTAKKSIEKYGGILLAKSMDEAMELSNKIAPEHLQLCVEDPFGLLQRVQNAGSVFLGNYSPEALGDYFAGPNHTLPTGGAARFASPLSVDDFTKKSSYTYYTRDALYKDFEKIARFAREEGLDAHARSAEIRFQYKPYERRAKDERTD